MSLFQPHGSLLQLNTNYRNSFCTWCIGKSLTYSAYISQRFWPQRMIYHGRANKLRLTIPMSLISPFTYSLRQPSSITLSAIPLDCDFSESLASLDCHIDQRTDCDSIDYLHILHESARIISVGLTNHESSKNYPKLAKAWVGVDADAWQVCIAYQAAVYALLKAVLAIVELSNDIVELSKDVHPVYNILSPRIKLVLQSLVKHLSQRDPGLVKCLTMKQVPALITHLTLVLERCAFQNVKRDEQCPLSKAFNGRAIFTLAIGCCIAMKKIAARISCPAFTMSLCNTVWELVESSPDFTSADRMHLSSIKRGVEHEFLMYFGPKVLDHDARENIIFWMGLIQEKLVVALCREDVITILQLFCRSEIVARDLAVIGLFAFLGRKTRLFLAQMGIKDLEEPVKDFICYLECGIVLLYPELSSICAYQLFMDVVTDEIAWLDLYAAEPSTNNQERKRLKHHMIQAEKEIILSTVFGVCLDVFSSFAHYSGRTEQSSNPNLQAYLHVSKCLLTFCLEDYWAAYDRLCELRKTTQVEFPELLGNLPKENTSIRSMQRRHEDIRTNVTSKCASQCVQQKLKHNCSDKILEMICEAADRRPHHCFWAKSWNSLLSATTDISVGTQLLFIDLKSTIGLIQKRIFGQTLTKWQRKKIARTIVDFLCVIPIAILMLLPVTAIGHAAMLTAIKRYIPNLIPSPYSKQRLDVVKQLKRAKKLKIQSLSNPNTISLAV